MTVIDHVPAGATVEQPVPLPAWRRNLAGAIGRMDVSVQQLVWAWLLAQRSPHTREAYGRDLTQWLTFLADRDVDPLQVRRGHGDAYGRWLEEHRGLEPRSAARKLSAVSSFYAYLEAEEITPNRVRKTTRPKVDRMQAETRGLSEDEARDLIAAADRDDGRARLRSSALIRFMLELGPRVSETLALTVGSLGFERGFRTVRIVGKGNKVRMRNVPPAAAAALGAYLEARAHALKVEVLDPDAPLFATSTGGRMTRQQVAELTVRLARRAGLEHPESVTPHSLRHTFATVGEERGASVKQLQHALGHASSSTTDIYIHARDQLERDPSQLVAAVLG
ncbi:tyrosine recombinase XerC [Acrocarpospora phusangensis]|uniref:Tyrosine recombinase XerC n=2 Tax=Acrocarpospora phusangensis TaxID=1070424 RepID=A0A919QC43_9ACTN|nr:tyrosine recombinase XerC [Acrocarpospora phusangensis]